MTKKLYYLSRYYNKTIQNIATSSFISDDVNKIFKLKNMNLSIEPGKSKKFHYMFLYLLTFGSRPHLNKYYIPWKLKYQKARVSKKSHLICKIKGKRVEKVLSLLFFRVFPQTFTAEKQVLHLNQQLIKLSIYHFPLIEKSLRLKSKSNYLPKITLHLTLQMKYTSIYQKIYLLQLFGLYKPHHSIVTLLT